MLFWTSRRLGWKDFEISDHNRQVIKATVTFDRAKAPAATLRRRLRDRLNRHPNTMGILWTNADDITTALAVSIEHIWSLTGTTGYKCFSILHVARNPVAHWMKPNLFLTRMFGQDDPPCPEFILTRNNLVWLTNLKIPSALSNYRYPMQNPVFFLWKLDTGQNF